MGRLCPLAIQAGMSARLTSPSLPLSKSPLFSLSMDRDDHAPALLSQLSTAAALDVCETEETALAFLDAAEIPTTIPPRDLSEFHGLTARNQARVLKMLEAVKIVEAHCACDGRCLCRGRVLGFEAAAAHLVGMKGASASRLRIMYGEYIREGRNNWRAFVDGALEYKPTTQIPAAFLTHLQEVVDAAKRDRAVSAAIGKMLVEWTMGGTLPGWGTWRQLWKLKHPALPMPSVCPWEHPPGCSLRNLRNYLDTSNARRLAITQGMQAAKAALPLVVNSRRGLWCMARVQFDDLVHDFFTVSMSGGRGAMGRPLEFFAHDVFTARKIRFGMRVIRDDLPEEERKGVNKRLMRQLLAAVMACDGYSPRGTVLVAEHGTAAISEDMERLLYDASGGLITVSRSGMTGAAAHDAQWGGFVRNKETGKRQLIDGTTSRGTPRHKGSLEKSNATVHALTADAPGQTGTNRDKRPEELGALLRYNEQLLAACAELPEHLRQHIRHPLLTEHQAAEFLLKVYQIFERMPHVLSGWEDNTVAEVFVLNAWLDAQGIATLPPHDQTHIMEQMHAGCLQTRQRRLNRLEAWQKGVRETPLIQPPPSVIFHLLGEDFAVERTVRGHQFRFQDRDLGPGEHFYEGFITDSSGLYRELPNGEKFATIVNPFAADMLGVFDAKGRYLGYAKPRVVAGPNLAEIHAALGDAARLTSEIMEPMRKRHAKAAKARLDLMEHNAGVVAAHQAAEAAAVSASLSALGSRAARSKAAKPAAHALPAKPAPQVADW